MSGFSNAPEIVEFEIGMEFECSTRKAANPWRVVHVWPDRTRALAICRIAGYDYFPRNALSECTLNMNSIWVGRQYYRAADPKWLVTVLLSDDEYVGIEHRDSFQDRHIWKREEFVKEWAPLPVPAAAKWKPEVAKPADWIVPFEGNGGTFTVLHIENGWAMLWDGVDAHTCEVSELCPPVPAKTKESVPECRP